MQQLYQIELTRPAERTYVQLYEQAQKHIAAGRHKHPAVATFHIVENAIDSILPNNPCDPHRALAGNLDMIYQLPLGKVYINYVVKSGAQAVIILTIAQTEHGRTVRKWLNNAIDTGAVDVMLQTLGIDHPCAKIEVSSRLLH
jgi:hypothetical protein